MLLPPVCQKKKKSVLVYSAAINQHCVKDVKAVRVLQNAMYLCPNVISLPSCTRSVLAGYIHCVVAKYLYGTTQLV